MARFNTALTSASITGTATIGSPNAGSFTNLTGTAPYTVTVPNPQLHPGVNQVFYNATSGTVTLTTPSGNFNGTGGNGTASISVFAGNVVSITSDGTHYIVISEDGSALTATSATISGVLTVQSSGGVAIAPSTTGTIDNVNVGATTRGSGSFNTLTANNAVTFTANTASSTTGTGTLVITGGLGVSGTINATSVSASLTGTLQTASQPNITSTGSLTIPGLTVDTSTLVVDATNDRVGVGTAGPGAVLHVVKTVQQTDFDNANQVLQLENTSTDTSGNVSGLRFRQTNGTNAANSFIGLSSTGDSSTRANLIFASPNASGNATIRMRVNALGQVFIGTTSTPYSGATGTGVYINGVSNQQTDLASLFVSGAKIGFAGIQSLVQNQLTVYDSTAGNGAGTGGAIAFGGNAGSGQATFYAAIESRKDNATAGDYGASLNFYTRPTGGYYTSPNMTISSSGNIYTPTGSAISYGDGTTYLVWGDEPEVSVLHTSADSSYKNMKTFVASKSGSFKLKFSAYIQSGPKYWGWRILKNGSTVPAGPYAWSNGLDSGQTASVHGYTRFAVTISDVTPGDSFVLQMVSTAGGSTPDTGSNQLLYAKEFRVYSTTPSVDHGGASHVWGAQVGVGTTSPQNTLQVNGSLSSYNQSSNAGAIATSYSEIVTTPINLGASVGVDVGTISVTTDTCWKAVVRGTFSNNYDGGGLTPPAFYIELNSVQNTIPCGGTSITVARNATTNKLQFTNTNATYRVAFTGTVEIIVNTQSGQSANSITTLGRIGIGVTSPAARLHVTGTGGGGSSTTNTLILQRTDATNPTGRIQFIGSSGTGGASWAILTDSSAGNAFTIDFKNTGAFSETANDKKMCILSSGNVGIATTTPGTLFVVQGGVGSDAGGAAGMLVRGNGAGASCPIYFNDEYTYPQKSIYMESYYLKIRGHNNEGVWILGSNASTAPSVNYKFQGLNSGSTCFNASNVSTWNTTSDRRVKTNVQPLSTSLAKIMQLQPVTFDYTDDFAKERGWWLVDEDGEQTTLNPTRQLNNIGFIAQDYKIVFPADVTISKEKVLDEEYEDFHTLSTDSVLPNLVKAVQELKTLVDDQKKLIEELQDQIKNLS